TLRRPPVSARPWRPPCHPIDPTTPQEHRLHRPPVPPRVRRLGTWRLGFAIPLQPTPQRGDPAYATDEQRSHRGAVRCQTERLLRGGSLHVRSTRKTSSDAT